MTKLSEGHFNAHVVNQGIDWCFQSPFSSHKATDDPTDDTTLRQCDLLLLHQKRPIPILGIKVESYRKNWKQCQYVVEEFWKRWTKRYLHELQERQIWRNVQNNLTMGDVVLLVDELFVRPITNVVYLEGHLDG